MVESGWLTWLYNCNVAEHDMRSWHNRVGFGIKLNLHSVRMYQTLREQLAVLLLRQDFYQIYQIYRPDLPDLPKGLAL
jgi:hypothetical protein